MLRARAEEAGLKGTILLAEEGINVFPAGEADTARGDVEELHTDPRFASLPTEECWSAEQPIRKMLVKLEREALAPDLTPRAANASYSAVRRSASRGTEKLSVFGGAAGGDQRCIDPRDMCVQAIPESKVAGPSSDSRMGQLRSESLPQGQS